MKRIKLNYLLLLIMALFATVATAYDFEVDGIYFNIINDNEAAVTYNSYSNNYSGVVIIPTTISYGGTSYTVTAIGDDAFNYCKGLKSVNIPNSVTSIDSHAFSECEELTSINIPSTVTDIGLDAFTGCYSIKSVFINDLEAWCKIKFEYEWGNIDRSPNYTNGANPCANGGQLLLNGEIITDLVIPNNVTSIGAIAFAGCSFNSVTIPSSVEHIGFNAFENCHVGRVNISDLEAWCNIDFDWECQGCYDIPRASPCSNGSSLFLNGVEIIDLVIPNSITSINECSFTGCSSISSVTFPSTVNRIGSFAFIGCTGLKRVNITDLEKWCSCSFGYNQINSIICTDFISNPCFYAEHLYLNGEEIIDLVIPISVKFIYDAFSGCSGLSSVTIPNSVTVIGYDVFWGCDNLKSVFITGEGEWQAGILRIHMDWYWDSYDSYYYSTIPNLYIDGGITAVKGMKVKPTDVFSFALTPPTCDENSFTDYSGTLHVPATSLAAYFTAPYWCNFANIVGDAVRLTGISIIQDSVEAFIGEDIQLNAEVMPANASASTINWVSSNPDVATVIDGEVTAVAYGECDIIATCLDQRAVCHVKVYSDRISVDPMETQILPNHLVALTPTSLADNLPALTVTSSDPTVAAARVMNGKVQVVGIKEGTTTITIGAADGTAKPANCIVTVYTETGDVNMDGFTDVSDVTTLISKVLGNEVENFKMGNADLNGDGVLDIIDVTALISLVLNN